MSDEMTATEIETLADSVFRAIESRDVAAIESMWADDIAVWHNTDGVEQTKDQNLAVMTWMFAHTASLEYRDVVRHVHTDPDGEGPGFSQRHALHLGFADGRTAVIPAAIFATLHDGRVVRIDEYLDSGQVSAAFPSRS